MTILQSSAEYGKIYYVECRGAIRQCRLVSTHGSNGKCWYQLEVAGIGEVNLPMVNHCSDSWWYTSQIESILVESPEDLRRGKFLTDGYGTTSNAHNYRFIKPFLPNYEPCVCGGGITFWKWDGLRARCYYENGEFPWRIDKDGFHCSINDPLLTEGRYDSKDACENANAPEVVTF